MLHSKYLIQNNQLIIIDNELGINLISDFSEDWKRQTFFSSGELKSKAYYKQGNLHGPSIYYTEEQNLLSKVWYFEGEKQGKAYLYYRSGKIYSLQRWKNNCMHGVQKYFYENGSLKTILSYSEGLFHEEQRLYWPNGKLKRQLTFEHGKQVGIEKNFSERNECLFSNK